MATLLGVLGTQEIIILLLFVVGPAMLIIPFFAYQQGRKRGRLEGRLHEMERSKLERTKQQNKPV